MESCALCTANVAQSTECGGFGGAAVQLLILVSRGLVKAKQGISSVKAKG